MYRCVGLRRTAWAAARLRVPRLRFRPAGGATALCWPSALSGLSPTPLYVCTLKAFFTFHIINKSVSNYH